VKHESNPPPPPKGYNPPPENPGPRPMPSPKPPTASHTATTLIDEVTRLRAVTIDWEKVAADMMAAGRAESPGEALYRMSKAVDAQLAAKLKEA